MDTLETCEVHYVDERKVKSVRGRLDETQQIDELSEIFKLLGDGTRLKILFSLKLHELCVCDLAALLGVTPSAISHQLRLLKSHRLVKLRRDGKISYYSLQDSHIADLINIALAHLKE